MVQLCGITVGRIRRARRQENRQLVCENWCCKELSAYRFCGFGQESIRVKKKIYSLPGAKALWLVAAQASSVSPFTRFTQGKG
jgi:hypothetical protein